MLIRNLQSLFDGSESQDGRLESGQPDVIAKKEDTTVIIPEKFKDDIERFESYCGVELKSGFCIEIELSELLEILPRERRRKVVYTGLARYLKSEYGATLKITSNKSKN